MSRYNKIFAGPWREAQPQAIEALASEDILPGAIVVMNGGKFALADAATRGKVWIAQDNYLTLKLVTDTWKAGDRVVAMEMLQEQFFHARVATGNDLAVGDGLAIGANGDLVKAAAGGYVVATAVEAYNNDTGEVQLVLVRPTSSYVAA